MNSLAGVFVLQGLNNLTALPGNKAVDPFVVGALGMRIPGLYTYKLQNTYNFLVSRILDFLLCGIAIAENYAAISTGQTVQSKIGIVIPKTRHTLVFSHFQRLPKVSSVRTEPYLPYWMAGARKEKALPLSRKTV